MGENPGLRRASTQDVRPLKAVLAEAFFEDPILGWLMPQDSKRLARLGRAAGRRDRVAPHARAALLRTSASASRSPASCALAAARHCASWSVLPPPPIGHDRHKGLVLRTF
jgi:hypothetical protein